MGSGKDPVAVACVGDVMLDVIVEVPSGLVADDDTPAQIAFAAGGQAANVAAWVVALGGSARLVGPRSDHGHGRLVTDSLQARGVSVDGPVVDRPGAVVSIVSDGTRSMASDAGDTSWLSRLEDGDWLHGLDWLFVSGYALLRAPTPDGLVSLAGLAHRRGARVAVDLASARMIQEYGARRFGAAWQRLEPDVVFANEAEWAATRYGTGGPSVLALKQGPAGASFVIDGVTDHRPPGAGPVVDATGAGDALAAGFLVGGVDLAMSAAARCVAAVGAQPAVGT